MRIKTKDLILIALFAALTAVGAFIKIPIPYVPFTLQVFFVVFSGLLLGSRKAAMAQIIYVSIGLVGVPIFANGGGIGYIYQPSFGYLLGFIAAAFIIGKISESYNEMTIPKAFIAIIPGIIVIYLFGVTYLYMILNLYMDKVKTISWALYNGCLIFIIGDLISSCFAAFISVKVLRILRKSGSLES